jgi:hypothetical protein
LCGRGRGTRAAPRSSRGYARDEATLRDAEAETLAALQAIREALAGFVTGAADIDAARSALQRVFESFTSTAVKNCSAPARPRRRARRQAETDIEAGEEREFSAPHRQIRLFDSTSGQALGSVEDPAVRPERLLALSA